MNTQVECAKCHAPMEVGYAFYFHGGGGYAQQNWYPGEPEPELLDRSRREERSMCSHHNASLPEVWVFGVVRN
jgi:hypothetical protein